MIEDRPRLLIATAISCAIGIIGLIRAWSGAKTRLLGNQGLLLTPEAILVIAQAAPARIPWPGLTGLRPHWVKIEGKGPDDVRNWLTFEATEYSGATPSSVLARTNLPTVNANDLGVDPHTVLAVCRFYLEHPDARGELPTRAALDRVRELETSP